MSDTQCTCPHEQVSAFAGVPGPHHSAECPAYADKKFGTPEAVEQPVKAQVYSDREILERLASEFKEYCDNYGENRSEVEAMIMGALKDAQINVAHVPSGLAHWDAAYPRPEGLTTNTLDMYLQTGVDIVFRIGITAVPIECVQGRDYRAQVQVYRFKAMSVAQCEAEQKEAFERQMQVNSFEELEDALASDRTALSGGKEPVEPAAPEPDTVYLGVNPKHEALEAGEVPADLRVRPEEYGTNEA